MQTEAPIISAAAPVPTSAPTQVDVCLVLEGSYPYVLGGVSSWMQELMLRQPELQYCTVPIISPAASRVSRYAPPPNLLTSHDIVLDFETLPGSAAPDMALAKAISDQLLAILDGGQLSDFAALIALLQSDAAELDLEDLLNSPLAWQVVRLMYERLTPGVSFLQFFWTWRALFGGLFATVKCALPPARVYHAVSTGYAGLFAARAALETGRPALVTEHGIYTNERRLEILIADWIAEGADMGFALSPEAGSLRGLWTGAFEAYAKICYAACERIVALSETGRKEQLGLGAATERTRIIANGVETEHAGVREARNAQAEPIVALIGRIVPIKDVWTFLCAIERLHADYPGLSALVLGPTDEDPDYHASCIQLVTDLGLDKVVRFTGPVRIADYLPRIDVVVLTSVSEGQPLVLLEAGASGIACVATDVGACREIIEGRKDEKPHLGQGGFVTGLVSPQETAEAIDALLRDPETRARFGANLQRRVQQTYSATSFREAYRKLYGELLDRTAAG